MIFGTNISLIEDWTKRKRVYVISSTWKTWIFQTNRIITKSSHFHTLLETISNCVQIIQFSEKLNKIENFDFRAKNEWFLIWFFTVKKSKFNTFNYGCWLILYFHKMIIFSAKIQTIQKNPAFQKSQNYCFSNQKFKFTIIFFFKYWTFGH